jgi:hypothetical protein
MDQFLLRRALERQAHRLGERHYVPLTRQSVRLDDTIEGGVHRVVRLAIGDIRCVHDSPRTLHLHAGGELDGRQQVQACQFRPARRSVIHTFRFACGHQQRQDQRVDEHVHPALLCIYTERAGNTRPRCMTPEQDECLNYCKD